MGCWREYWRGEGWGSDSLTAVMMMMMMMMMMITRMSMRMSMRMMMARRITIDACTQYYSSCRTLERKLFNLHVHA